MISWLAFLVRDCSKRGRGYRPIAPAGKLRFKVAEVAEVAPKTRVSISFFLQLTVKLDIACKLLKVLEPQLYGVYATLP